MPKLQLGTSSWNFPDWKSVFYPSSIPSNQYLHYYAGCFPTVEVNTSFYGLPRPSTLLNWLETVPPGFTFCLKAPRAISHEKRLVDCRSETLAYLDALRSLGSAVAPALLQLPPTLSRARNGRVLAEYISWLADELDGLQLAVEVRSPDLMTAAFASFLASNGMAITLVDRVGTLDLFPIWAEIIDAGNAPDFCLLRWIGDDKNGPEGNQELTNPRENDLDKWATRIQYLLKNDIDVYGYMHNPYEGHSPASVQRLQERLAGHRYIDNPNAIDQWPPKEWTKWGKEENESQLSLFGEF